MPASPRSPLYPRSPRSPRPGSPEANAIKERHEKLQSSKRGYSGHLKNVNEGAVAKAPHIGGIDASDATDVGVNVRLLKLRGVDPVAQTFSAKIGIFLYWTDNDLKGRLARAKTDDHRKICEESKPRYIVENLLERKGVEAEEKDFTDFKTKDNVVYAYEPVTATFSSVFEEPDFPYQPPNILQFTLKMRDPRYKFVVLEQSGGTRRSFVKEDCAKEAPAWVVYGLPDAEHPKLRTFSELEAHDELPEECDPKRKRPFGIGPYMQESANGMGGFQSQFTAAFKCKRVTGFYIMNYVVPSSLLCVLSLCSFAISDKMADLRPDMGCTILLTMLAMRLTMAGELPKTGVTTYLDTKLQLSFFYAFAVTVTHILLRTEFFDSDYDAEEHAHWASWTRHSMAAAVFFVILVVMESYFLRKSFFHSKFGENVSMCSAKLCHGICNGFSICARKCRLAGEDAGAPRYGRSDQTVVRPNKVNAGNAGAI